MIKAVVRFRPGARCSARIGKYLSRKRGLILMGAAVLLLAPGAESARALTLTVMPSADTCMRDNAPDMTSGDVNPLLVGNSKDPFTVHNRALLKFDVSSIPTNAIVTDATLMTVIFRSNTGPANYDLHRVLVDWNEYEATWNNRSASTAWLAGGGQSGTEFVSQPSVTAQIDDAIFSSAGTISDVQQWVGNSGTNYGWIMLPTGDLSGTGKQIGSRESVYSSTLTVEYSLPGPAATVPAIFDVALSEQGFRFSFNVESNRPYAVEFRDVLASDAWNILTNISAQPVDGIINVTNAASSTERYFRVRTP
jgi:hypothetical protein